MNAFRVAIPLLISILCLSAPAAVAQESPGESRRLETLLDRTLETSVRAAAATWIMNEKYDSRAAIEAMLQGIADATLTPSARRSLSVALTRIAAAEGGEELAERLYERAASGAVHERRPLCVALGRLVESRVSASHVLLERVRKDDDAAVRRAALRSLGNAPAEIWSRPGAADVVRGALQDTDEQVRQATARFAALALPREEALDAIARLWLGTSIDFSDIFGASLMVGRGGAEALAPRFLTTIDDATADEERRLRAADGLASLGHRAAGVAEDLGARLASDDGVTRLAAARALAGIGRSGGSALPQLVEALDDPDDRVVTAAIRAIGKQDQEELAGALENILDHENTTVAAAAAHGLARVATSHSDAAGIVKTLATHPSAEVRASAARGLRIPESPRHVQSVWDALWSSSYADMRRIGVIMLHRVWTAVEFTEHEWMRAEFIHSRLLEAMRDRAPEVRATAFDSCSMARITDEAARGAAERALNDDDAAVRRYAALLLGKCGPAARGAVADLVGLLDDPDDDVRKAAVISLGSVAAGDATAATNLVRRLEVLKDDRRGKSERRMVLDALGNVGPATATVVPALRNVLELDEDETTRRRAATALVTIGLDATGTLDAIILAFDDTDGGVRDIAVGALGVWSAVNARAAEALIPAFTDESDNMRQHACAVAGGGRTVLGEPQASETAAQILVPSLITVLAEDDVPTVRRAAIRSLLRMEPDSDRTRDALAGALRDEYSHVRRIAASALVRYGARALPVIDALIAALDDPDTSTAAAAARALGAIGPEAAGALPALERNTERERTAGRDARAAVRRIRGG